MSEGEMCRWCGGLNFAGFGKDKSCCSEECLAKAREDWIQQNTTKKKVWTAAKEVFNTPQESNCCHKFSILKKGMNPIYCDVCGKHLFG